MLKTIVGLVVLAVSGLSIYASGAGLVPYYVGIGTVRVRSSPVRLRISANDAGAMHALGYAVFALVPLLLARGLSAFAVGALAAVALSASLRVVVESDGRRTRLVRRVLWVVPWRTTRFEGLPDAYVDGWGDFADPAALFVGAPGVGAIELGWSHRGNEGRAESLAAEITEWRAKA